MPYSSQRDFRGKHPIDTFPYIVSIDNTGSLFDGTGSLITYVEVSCSYAKSASYEIIYETSSSFADWAASASVAISSSWASSSYDARAATSASWASSSVTASVLAGLDANSVVFANVGGVTATDSTFTYDSLNGKLSVAGNGLAAKLTVAELELEQFSINNAWLSDNLYYDDPFKYNNTGYGTLIYFLSGEEQHRLSPSSSSLSHASTGSQLKISNNGWVAIGGKNISPTIDSITGATMVVYTSSVNIYAGGLTSSVFGTSSWARSMSASGIVGGLTQDIYLLSASVTTMSFVNGALISVV